MHSLRFFLVLSFLSMTDNFAVMAADELPVARKSAIAGNLYEDPLTARPQPIGYRENPIGWREKPLGFRDHPIGWRETPLGYREAPLTQLEEPRNGRPEPIQFVERDSIIVANAAPGSVRTIETHPSYNGNDGILRVPPEQSEATRISGHFYEKDPGYGGANPPSKARLPGFQ